MATAVIDANVLVGLLDEGDALTGWEPRIPFEQTMADLLDWWCCRLEPQRVVTGLECGR